MPDFLITFECSWSHMIVQDIRWIYATLKTNLPDPDDHINAWIQFAKCEPSAWHRMIHRLDLLARHQEREAHRQIARHTT